MTHPPQASALIAPRESSRAVRRALALATGVACHGAFLVAVSTMLVALHGGLARNGLVAQGRLHGGNALAANAALALQFPLAHSFLLTARGRALLARLAGRHGRVLTPTSYVLVASLQLLATFTLWSPSHIVWWRPEGTLRVGLELVNVAAWLFLGKALLDGGPGLQSGWIGWTALWRGSAVRFPPLAQNGLFARCRQPIYLGFALTLWSGPTWTPDRLGLAALWTLYCVLGPLHKERRYARIYGAGFEEYRRVVPYMLPLRRAA